MYASATVSFRSIAVRVSSVRWALSWCLAESTVLSSLPPV